MDFHQTYYVCIDSVDICFWIANGQISSNLDRDLPAIHPYFTFRRITWVNLNGFSPNLICALLLLRSAVGLLFAKFRKFLTVICPWHDSGGVLSFHVLFQVKIFLISSKLLTRLSTLEPLKCACTRLGSNPFQWVIATLEVPCQIKGTLRTL